MKVWISCFMTVWASMIGINHLNGGEIPIRLVEVTEESGIGFRHSDGSESGQRHISESVASGLATFDYNGDGLVDLLFLNGWDFKASVSKDGSSLPGRNALYRNEGGWRFTDVSTRSGLMSRRHHLGVCVGDVNEDGLPDLYFSNFGSDILYRNLGDGTFLDVTAQSGLASLPAFGAGALFLDMDADGDLDLFVAQYCDFTLEKHQLRYVNGFPAYTGPMTYGPVADRLYENQGDGTFKDVSASSGIASRKGTGMGVVATDFDNDGDQDIVVGNDAMANFVWRNDGAGHFTEVGLLSGLAFDANGVGLGTMGVDCADFN
ncbi:MAG: FG-GAP repeat domain-containing protein, partial [Limisphaerales bacterium]